jgi:hypothetical protein
MEGERGAGGEEQRGGERQGAFHRFLLFGGTVVGMLPPG